MEPRPAATVIVARPAIGGVEVLAVARAEASRFAPGFVVFPGGTIEPEDEALAARLFGDPDEAARACGIRELYEEAGVLLSAEGPVAVPSGGSLGALRFDPPSPDALVEVARWIAPEALEVRFDARFFVTAAPAGLEPRADGVEVSRAWWARPTQVLEEHGKGEVPLAWPTQVTLEALASCRSVADVLALRLEQVPRPT
jgi:8-oxo-dGTP pyrophosphatase MutT (NUDIX family)